MTLGQSGCKLFGQVLAGNRDAHIPVTLVKAKEACKGLSKASQVGSQGAYHASCNRDGTVAKAYSPQILQFVIVPGIHAQTKEWHSLRVIETAIAHVPQIRG
jgi:hypothetical protein